MREPEYQADIKGIVEELRRAHGPNALDVAVTTAKQHMAISGVEKFRHVAASGQQLEYRRNRDRSTLVH